MKRIQIIVATLVAVAGKLEAQTDTIGPMPVRLPAAPAFVLIGAAPSAVERPGTPRAMAVTLLNATKNGSIIPRDFALEFAPFAETQSREAETYLEGGALSDFARTMSFSLATAYDSAGGTTTVGLGVRGLLARGKVADDLDQLVQARRQAIVSIATQMAVLQATQPVSAAERRKVDSLERAGMEAVTRLREATRPQGLRLEVAAALAIEFPEDRFAGGEVSRLGGWLTLSHWIPAPRFDLTGVGRVIVNTGAGKEGGFADAGFRLTWEPAPFALSFEAVRRIAADATVEQEVGGTTIALDVTGTYRAAGQLDLMFGDGQSITFTFGRDFAEGTIGEETLLASLALNLGLGGVPWLTHLR